jgi:hypothetical protein
MRAAVFTISLPSSERLSTRHLEDCITSGEFFVYDPIVGRPAPSDVYLTMQQLLDSVESYRSLFRTFERHWDSWNELGAAVRRKDPHVRIAGDDLALLLRLHDVMQDIVRFAIALERHILDPAGELRVPTVSAISPIEEMIPQVEKERVRREDVERWARDPFLWSWLTGEHAATVSDAMTAMQAHPALREVYDAAISEDLTFIQEHRGEFIRRSRKRGHQPSWTGFASLRRRDGSVRDGENRADTPVNEPHKSSVTPIVRNG